MDRLTSRERSKQMSLIKSKNTIPELTVRKLVYGMSFRYRLHVKNLPGKPDLVFKKKRKVIFVHGCFWHQHADSSCKIARLPKTRLDYWIPKLTGNNKRDIVIIEELHKLGWQVLVIWECQLKSLDNLETILKEFLHYEID